MDKSAERILVVPTTVFHEIGVFQGFQREVERYLPRLLDPAHLSFRLRSEAETDPSFKQLIPYVVLKCGDLLFHYRRGSAGTEKRLETLRSVGIGGHISAEDAEVSRDAYREGMLREIAEEVYLETTYRELMERGVEFVQPPKKESWGTSAIFKDAEANSLVIGESCAPQLHAHQAALGTEV